MGLEKYGLNSKVVLILGGLNSDILLYFEVQRRELLNAISPYVNPSLKLLLTGDSTLSPQINNEITLKVHKYIIDTHRF